MPIRTLSRRQILVGSAGFCLGLPILRSLLPREVNAQSFGGERRFVAIATDHGGLLESAMFPDRGILDEPLNLYTGHTVRRGDLAAAVSGSEARISQILRGSSDRLTSSLVSKMNVIQGVDIPWYIAHHTGGHLGNFARNDGNGEEGKTMQGSPMPTIDQIMAWSDGFYGDLSGITERAMIFGSAGLSYNWSNPSARTGEIQQVSGTDDPYTMFQSVFVPEDDPDAPEPRPPVVDRVFASYQSLRQSNRRLSSEDKQRLDDHMDRLSELERKLNIDAVRRAACGSTPEPAGDEQNIREYYQMINDVIVTAFLCGTSRIAVVKVRESGFVDYAGDWHQEVAHQHTAAEPQALLQDVNQKAFEHVVLDLAYKLDIEDAPGSNVLDSSMIQWTQESGETTHDARSIPLVTFGSAGGAIRTGNFCDYTKRTPEGLVSGGSESQAYSGLLYSQWLAMALQSLGVARSEFQGITYNADAGYGAEYVDESYAATHSDGVLENASAPLPFLDG